MKLKGSSTIQSQEASTPALHVTPKPFVQSESCHVPSREEIGQKAYFCYLNEGSRAGHDVHDWLEAEADLKARYNFDRCQA